MCGTSGCSPKDSECEKDKPKKSADKGSQCGSHNSVAARVTTLEASVADLDQRVTTLEASVADLDQRVTTTEGSITNLDQRVTTTEGNIIDLDQRVTTTEGNIIDLDQRVISLEDYRDSNDERVSIAEERITTLEQTTTDLQQRTGTLEGQVSNLENIHSKAGWHTQQIKQALYLRPRDLLVYYGWPSAFNSAENQWNLDKVSQDMARYGLIVLGQGLEDPGHGDHTSTVQIIQKVKALNPSTLIFGYVTANQDIALFEAKADQWIQIAVDGIFADEAGYDFGVKRTELNERIDYVHGEGKIIFPNAWNTKHLLGVEDDPSYPNSTYNPNLAPSALTPDDWVLLESFAVNTESYLDGVEAKEQWAQRGSAMLSLRASHNVNFAAVSMIANDHASAESLFEFAFVSGLMWSLEAFGSSDVSYGSGSATVKLFDRPKSLSDLGGVWSLNPSVQLDLADQNRYLRFLASGKLVLDFNSKTGSIVSH